MPRKGQPSTQRPAGWSSSTVAAFSRDGLYALINNELPALRISDFADASEINALTSALSDFKDPSYSVPQVKRLGISQYQQGLCSSKEHYLTEAVAATKEQQQIFKQSFDPIDRILQLFKKEGFHSSVMTTDQGESYFAGSGKLRNGFSPIHVDFAPQDSSDWEVGACRAQLAWNLYLNVPSDGGELLIWDKQWIPQDDTYQVSDSYHYHQDVVKDAQKLTIKVFPGEILLINSRNFHAVAESKNRLSIGSFISYFEDDSLKLWS